MAVSPCGPVTVIVAVGSSTLNLTLVSSGVPSAGVLVSVLVTTTLLTTGAVVSTLNPSLTGTELLPAASVATMVAV